MWNKYIMARAARLALADMRATQKQMKREEMHGAGLVGGGGVPSMGLSQFRGGARRGCGKSCRGCEMCMGDESSSDEEEMHGGAWYSSALGALGIGARAATAARAAESAAARAAAAETALAVRGVESLVPFSSSAASRSLAARLASLNSSSSRVLATRTPGVVKPYNPAEAAFRLSATAPGKTMAARLASMGITPARVAAALAAGVAITGLADYFANEAAQQSGDAGYYDDTHGHGPGGPGAPGGPSGPTVVDGVMPPPPPGLNSAETDMYLRTGNVPYRYLEGSLGRRKQGGRKAPNPSDGRSKRAAIVRKVMAEQKLSLPMASKYVKENGLY